MLCRYVLDVRNNGGGLFPAGVELARMLIESGDIVLIADSQGVMDSYEATGTAIESKAPVAVLVNKGTASASEVTILNMCELWCPSSQQRQASYTLIQ